MCSLDRKHKRERNVVRFSEAVCREERGVTSQSTTAWETGFMKAKQLSQVIIEPTRVINGTSTTATVIDFFVTSNFIFGVRKVSFPSLTPRCVETRNFENLDANSSLSALKCFP